MRRTLSLTLVVLLVPTASASAQDGAIVDKGDPTSKEYAIPLEDARRDAAAAGDPRVTADPSTRSAPLFGEGVGPDPGRASASASSPSSASSHGGKDAKPDDRATSTPADRGSDVPSRGAGAPGEAALPSTPTDPVASPDGDAGTLVTVLGLAAGVLLLGGVLGSVLRRRPLT